MYISFFLPSSSTHKPIALNLVAMQMGNDMSPLTRGSVNLEDQLTSLVTMINGGRANHRSLDGCASGKPHLYSICHRHGFSRMTVPKIKKPGKATCREVRSDDRSLQAKLSRQYGPWIISFTSDPAQDKEGVVTAHIGEGPQQSTAAPRASQSLCDYIGDEAERGRAVRRRPQASSRSSAS